MFNAAQWWLSLLISLRKSLMVSCPFLSWLCDTTLGQSMWYSLAVFHFLQFISCLFCNSALWSPQMNMNCQLHRGMTYSVLLSYMCATFTFNLQYFNLYTLPFNFRLCKSWLSFPLSLLLSLHVISSRLLHWWGHSTSTPHATVVFVIPPHGWKGRSDTRP